MSLKRWIGNATAVYDIWTISLSGTVTSQTYSVTINGKSITYVAGSTATVSTVLAGIVSAWTSTTSPAPVEFGELTPVAGTSTITVTANTAGNPCTLSVSTTGGATYSIAHTQTATGPHDFANAQNWSGGVAPANSDTLVFDNGSTDCLYNLNTTLTGIVLQVQPGFSGNIGLSFINNNSNSAYVEYRTQYLTLAGGTANVNAPSVGLLKLAFGANTATVEVLNTGRRSDTYTPPMLITGGNSSSVLAITKGDVGVAFFQGESAQFSSILTSYQSQATSDVTLYCGSGTTIGSITKNGGSLTINSNVTTLLQGVGGGTVTVAAGAVTTMTIEAGTAVWNSTGTLGTVTIAGPSTLDFSQDPTAKTVTNPIQVYGDAASINDPFKVVNNGTLSVTTNQTTKINVSHGSGNVMSFA